MSNDLLWREVLEKIKNEVNSSVYSAWFEKSRILKIENNTITLVVQIKLQQQRLLYNYRELLLKKIFEVTHQMLDFTVLLEEDIEEEPKIKEIDKTHNNVEKNKDNETITNTEKIDFKHSSNLIKSYNFDTFVVGNSNRLAHSTALAVAEVPAERYNPLFIYGSSGLGKTHLMHAIGNYIEENSDKKVLYVKCKDFIDDFIKMILNNNSNQDNPYVEYFKNKYRSIDVLIIDDIQFLSTAPKTQDEFVHTFNDLYYDTKQIIISSDRSPNDLQMFEERLKTRFCWGISVDISPPDAELRKNILKKKIAAQKLFPEISEDVIEYIASKMTDDVRSLEGAINRLMAYSFMMGYSEITLPIAVEALSTMINKGTSEKNDIAKIQKVVADHYQISVDDLKSKKRSAPIAGPRHIAMYLSRVLLNESYERIGLEFGGKDHSTVMNAVEKIKYEIDNNEETKIAIEKIKQDIS